MDETPHLELHRCADCTPDRREVVAEKATLKDTCWNIHNLYRTTEADVDYLIDNRKGGE